MKTQAYSIVVGVDFSEQADQALSTAFALAMQQQDAEVHVVSIVPGPNMDPNYRVPDYALAKDQGDGLEGASERLRAHVQTRFDAFDAALPKRPQDGTLRVVSHARVDSPALGIVQLASDLDADLIVVGTHGRHGISRALLGSVAESTVRNAHCPVLVVRQKIAVESVKIEPPCQQCLSVRAASHGAELWCEQHRERHGRRHTYHQTNRSGGETNLPLFVK
jgi:nucleotide-binding universal stress UspA family protein